VSEVKIGCFLIAFAWFSLLTPAIAQAQALDAAIAKFAADDYAETSEAIAMIAASGSPQSTAVLEALAARRLFFIPSNKSVVYQDATSKVFDAASGKSITALPADATVVRVNNRVRGLIEAAVGGLALQAPDPERRLQAIEQIGKGRDAKALPSLDAALAKEQDRRVRNAINAARAGIILAAPDSRPVDQLEAIKALEGRTDTDALTTLRMAAQAKAPEVRQLADAAIAAIERRQRITNVIQNIWYGLSLGSVLLLAAAGLAITFGVMGVINMAHGEMVMIGAYTTYVVQEAMRSIGWMDAALPLSIPAAFLVAGGIGVAIERGIIRFLYGRPLETLLATWGVSLILQQAVRDRFGASNVQVSSPPYMSGFFDFFGLQITYGRLWIIVFTLLAFAALQLVIKVTPLGLQMRAVTQNRRMASAMGIRTGRVDALTFGLGCGIAGVAGVALSQIDNVAPNLGQSYIVDCFMVVVFGGVGNLWGTFVSAFSLGIANKMLEPVAGAVLAKIFILVLLILFIQKRPRGLFALKGRAIEA
jgi:urea transport system permease protein